jgi:hypothetical protein
MGRSLTAAQPRKRDADTKLAESRLSVLELAKALGNVAEACRQRGSTGPVSTNGSDGSGRRASRG